MFKSRKKIWLFSQKFLRKITLRDKSLQFKIVLCYLLVIIPIVIIGFNFYSRYSKMVVENSLESVSQIDQQLSEKIDRVFQEAENFTILFDYSKNIKDLFFYKNTDTSKLKGQDLVVWLDEIKKFEITEAAPFMFNQNFKSFQLFDVDGVNLYSSSKDGANSDILKPQKQWLDNVKPLKGRSYIISPYVFKKYGINSFYFSSVRALFDNDHMGKIIGIVVLNMNVKVLEDLLHGLDLGPASKTLILDKENNVVYSPDSKEISMHMDDSIFNSLPKVGHIRGIVEERDSYISCFTSKYTNWKVVSIVPSNFIFEELDQVKSFTIFLVALCILIGLIITIYLANKIATPLKRLTRLMSSHNKDSLLNKAKISSKDEIGLLGRSFNRMLTRIDKLIQTVYLGQIKEKQTKLDALQIQINPHFLYNTLETARMMADINKDYEVANILEILGRLLRYGINSFNQKATLRDEIEHLKNYIYIQNYRFSDRFEAFIKVEDSLLDEPVIKLIIQPIVENAIYHGLEGDKKKSRLDVSIFKDNGEILIDVKDDGAGMNQETLEKLRKRIYEEADWVSSNEYGKGIGLRNVYERIRIYYGEKSGLEIQSEPGKGTNVRIRICNDKLLEPGRVFNENSHCR